MCWARLAPKRHFFLQKTAGRRFPYRTDKSHERGWETGPYAILLHYRRNYGFEPAPAWHT